MSGSDQVRTRAARTLADFERVVALQPEGELGLFQRVCLVAGADALGLGVLLACAGARVELAEAVGAGAPEEQGALLRELLLQLRQARRWLDPDPLLGALSSGAFQPTQLRACAAEGGEAAYDLAVGVAVPDGELEAVATRFARALRHGGHAALLMGPVADPERACAALARAGLRDAAVRRDGGGAAVARGIGGLVTEFPTEQISSQIQSHSRARYALLRGLAPGRRILDVGCGAGLGTRRLAEFGAASLVGVEGCAEALELARRAPFPPGVPVEWRQVDLERGLEELPDGEFDLVVCLEVLEHVRAQRDLVAGLRRVLRPEGTLVLSVPHRAFELRWQALGVENPYHVHVPDRAELEAHLAGFARLDLFVQADVAASVVRPLDGSLPAAVPLRVQDPGRLADDGTISLIAVAGPAGQDVAGLLPSEGWAYGDHQADLLRLTAECRRLERDLAAARQQAARAKWLELTYPSGADETLLRRALGHARWLGHDLLRRLDRA